MQIPKKITPDRIRESLVQFTYGINIPFIPSIGYFHSLLSLVGYEFTSKNEDKSEDKQLISLEQVFINYTDKIKVQINPNQTLTFNCAEEYIGWEIYYSKIHEIVEILFSKGLITGISRIGIRYISEFPGINIYDNISLKYNFPLVEVKNNKNVSFRIEEIDEDNDLKIINIHANKKLENGFLNVSESNSLSSIIDVDIIKKDIQLSDCENVMASLINLHNKEKFVFFNILKDDFIKTLNPEY